MNPERWGEFFEDDVTHRKSMTRLVSLIALIVLSLGFFWILLMCVGEDGLDLGQKLNAMTTLAITIAGLGGFNYAAGRMSGAYTQVRVEKVRAGMQDEEEGK